MINTLSVVLYDVKITLSYISSKVWWNYFLSHQFLRWKLYPIQQTICSLYLHLPFPSLLCCVGFISHLGSHNTRPSVRSPWLLLGHITQLAQLHFLPSLLFGLCNHCRFKRNKEFTHFLWKLSFTFFFYFIILSLVSSILCIILWCIHFFTVCISFILDSKGILVPRDITFAITPV